MSWMSKVLGIVSLVAALALNAAGAQEKKVEFALTGNVMIGEDFEGEMGGLIGPGARVDFIVGTVFMISTEAMLVLGWGSLAPAFTLNLRIGRHGYVGAGPFVTLATHDGAGVVSLKAHLGVKFGPALFEVSIVTAKPSSHTWGGSPGLLGITLGFVF